MSKDKKMSRAELTKMLKEEYWAAADQKDIGSELMKKVDDYFTALTTSGQYHRLQSSYSMYYGQESTYPSYDSLRHGIKYGGERGELQFLKTNHFRNVLKNLQNLILANRPAMECRATNTTYEALMQAKLCLLYTSPSPRDRQKSRMPSSA